MAEDRESADSLAGELKDLNEQRKDMTLKGTEEAIEQVEAKYQDDKVLVVFFTGLPRILSRNRCGPSEREISEAGLCPYQGRRRGKMSPAVL